MLRGYRAVSLPKSLKEFAINVCVPLLLFPLCAVLGGLAVFAVFALINVDAALEFFDWVF